MAFTPPSYNAVDVQFTGDPYTPPAYNAVDISWVPVLKIRANTQLAFVGQWFCPTQFGLSSSTTCYFELPFRDLSISSSSAANFVTWQRTIAFALSSSTLFRAGFIAGIQNSTTLNLSLIGAIQAIATIASASTPAFARQALVNRTIQITGNTTTQLKGGRNYDTAILVHGRTVPNFRSANLYGAAFTGTTESALSFRGEALIGAAFSVYGAASASFASRTGIESSAAIPLASTTSFYGVPAWPSAATLQGAANAAFVSNYAFVVVNTFPVDADCVFAKTSTYSVYVLQ